MNGSTNTVSDGEYSYVASTANGGQLQVINNSTGQVIDTVWGDPHVNDANGGGFSFQQGPVSFAMSNGTEVTLTPTQTPGQSAQYLQTVTITTAAGSSAEFNYSSQPGQSVGTENLGSFNRGLGEALAAGSTQFAVSQNGNLIDLENGQTITSNNVGTIA